MSDARTIEHVRSWTIDFETDEWIVKPVAPGYSIGAGIYLMVPVDPMRANSIREAIERLLVAYYPDDERSDDSGEHSNDR